MSGLPFVSLLLASAIPTDDAARESRLLAIARDRATITSGEVTLRVRFLQSYRNQEQVNSEWTDHYWFESDRSVFRLDQTRGDGRRKGDATTSRYGFDGKSYKLIPETDNLISLQEFVKNKPVVASELFDARLLGIRLVPFKILHNYTLNDIDRIVTNAVSWDREETADGFVETYQHKNGLKYDYHFSKDGWPVRVTNTAANQPGVRYESRIAYDGGPQGPYGFPSRIEFEGYDGKELTDHEIWNVEVLQLNRPIDPAIASWKALDPKVGAKLVVDGGNYQVDRIWNGDGFVPYREQTGPGVGKAQYQPASPRPYALWLAAGCTVVLGSVLGYRLIRPVWPRS